MSQRFEKQIGVLRTQAEIILTGFQNLAVHEEQHLKKYLQLLRSRLNHFEKHSRAIQRAISELVLD